MIQFGLIFLLKDEQNYFLYKRGAKIRNLFCDIANNE